MRLNPFEFRAGIYFQGRARCHTRGCLNPFEFRAGIYFVSGCGFKSCSYVLIPLNSGLVFTSITTLGSILIYGLNPFEFRAGIYFDGFQNIDVCKVVLIPLNSGLVFT